MLGDGDLPVWVSSLLVSARFAKEMVVLPSSAEYLHGDVAVPCVQWRYWSVRRH
jgi:hypothetical protein